MLGMVEREMQGHRAPERGALDVSALETELVHHGDDGASEIGERLAALIRLVTPARQLEQQDTRFCSARRSSATEKTGPPAPGSATRGSPSPASQ